LTDSPSRQRKPKLAKDIARVVLVVAIFVGAALLFRNEAVREHLFDIQKLRELLHPEDGALQSYVIFTLAGGALVGLGLPRLWLSFAAGAIYGSALGTGLSMMATMIGATVTYMLGRSLMRGVVRRRLGRRVEAWNERFRRNGFLWTLYLRLFPLSNATMTSLLAGSGKVSLGAFSLGNLIGFLPLTVVFALAGSGAAKANNHQLTIGAVSFVLVMAAQWYYTRKLGLKGVEEEEEKDEG
jgi:uncharacterized membrane protein YdjX (TVP38/TMEM64 family)